MPLPTVWLYWQGPRPPLVDLCIETIRRHNPTTRLLTLADVQAMPGSAELLDLTAPLRPAWRSNLLRLWLIWQHGGVWVDADSICTAPLELVAHACHYDLVAVRNPGFTARETPLGGRAGSPILAEAYQRYADILRRFRRQQPINRLLRAHIPRPIPPQTAMELPYEPYYPCLYRQIPTLMLRRPDVRDPSEAVLWPINHFVYQRLAAWDAPRLLRCQNFLGAALRYALRPCGTLTPDS